MSDDDGEADRRQIQMFVTAVAGYAAQVAREREERQQRAAAENVEAARVVQAQLAAERSSAQALWQPTLSPDWWTQASVEDVQRAYQAAAEWAPIDENAARAADAIAERVGVEPAASTESIAQTRSLAPEEAADVHNAEWDSRGRRAETSTNLAEVYRSAGVAEEAAGEAVEAERIADVGQAQPAHAAVAAGTAESSSRSVGAGVAISHTRQRSVKRSR